MESSGGIYGCSMEATLELIGGKWKGVILWHLTDGPMRFSELRRLMPRATPKMLTQQLRDLENDLLILRTVYPVVPPKVEYALTDQGRSLIPVLKAMSAWGREYMRSTGRGCLGRYAEGKATALPEAESRCGL